MIRSFHLRDWRLLSRLGERSVSLNTKTVLLERSHPLQTAFLYHVLRRNYPTYVWRPRARDAEAFVQYKLGQDGTQGHLLWIGSALPSQNSDDEQVHEEIWLGLLERLTILMGDAGVQSMVAEVPEDSAVCSVLKQAGFVTYTRQDMWRLTDLHGPANVNVTQDVRPTAEWDIEVMYSHIVPNLIRMVEPHPQVTKDGWVRYEGNDPVAYAHIEQGKLGMMLSLLVSLSAEIDPKSLVRGIVSRQKPSADNPLYCAIRNYQDWLNDPLEAVGFEHIGSQVVMVKNTVQKVKYSVTRLEEVLAKQGGAKAQPSPAPWHSSDVMQAAAPPSQKEY